MKANTVSHLLQALLIAALSSMHPAVHAQNSATRVDGNASVKTGTSGMPSTPGSTQMRGSGADTASDDQAIQNLRAAAQNLRESIQNLARMPAGEKRTEAIKEGNEALIKVQSAIAALPPELLTADANESSYKKSLEKMKLASDRLYSAAEALANQPPGKARSDAVKKVNSALLQTNEAMLTGLQLSAADASKSPMKGSAAVTGRPGANNVDLSQSSGSGAPTSSKGTGDSGSSSASASVGNRNVGASGSSGSTSGNTSGK